MHFADAFIQSELQNIQAEIVFVSMSVPWELNPQPFLQCSTTELQEHCDTYVIEISEEILTASVTTFK